MTVWLTETMREFQQPGGSSAAGLFHRICPAIGCPKIRLVELA